MGIQPEDTFKHQYRYDIPSSDDLLKMAENDDAGSMSGSGSDTNDDITTRFLMIPLAGVVFMSSRSEGGQKQLVQQGRWESGTVLHRFCSYCIQTKKSYCKLILFYKRKAQPHSHNPQKRLISWISVLGAP